MEKVSEGHKCVTFFWLVKNYIYFSYPKCGNVVMGSEIGKFKGEDKRCCIRKCNQCVTHLWPIWDSSGPICNNVWPHVTHLWPICNPTRNSSVTYFYPILWTMCDPYVTHLWLICDLRESHLLPISWFLYDLTVIHPVTHVWPICYPNL